MIFVGDDWAKTIMTCISWTRPATRLASRRLPEGLAGIRRFHELSPSTPRNPEGGDRHRDRPGLWVAALIAAGYQVFAINPLAVARYRDRHHVSGAKSDAADAKLLADLVRTDRHNHRRRRGQRRGGGDQGAGPGPSEPDLGPHPAHQRLRNALREYYPAALDGLRRSGPTATPWRCWAAPPPPTQGARLSLAEIRSALKRGWTPTQPRHPRPRDPGRAAHRAARRARRGHCRVRRHHPARPSASSPSSTARSPTSRPSWPTILRHTRTPTSTAPCQDLVSSSAPGCSVSSGTTRTIRQRQVSQELRRNLTPHHRLGQETRRAGPPRPQPPPLRRHRPMGLLRPIHTAPAPAPSTTTTAPPGPHHQALRALGNRLVGILHGCLRHHTSPTTNTPPGHTDITRSGLTPYEPGMSNWSWRGWVARNAAIP